MSFTLLSLLSTDYSLSPLTALSSLAALIILSLAYSRFRGLFGQDNKNMSLTVKWGRERFVAFPPRPLTRLALTVHLRRTLSILLSICPHSVTDP